MHLSGSVITSSTIVPLGGFPYSGPPLPPSAPSPSIFSCFVRNLVWIRLLTGYELKQIQFKNCSKVLIIDKIGENCGWRKLNFSWIQRDEVPFLMKPSLENIFLFNPKGLGGRGEGKEYLNFLNNLYKVYWRVLTSPSMAWDLLSQKL